MNEAEKEARRQLIDSTLTKAFYIFLRERVLDSDKIQAELSACPEGMKLAISSPSLLDNYTFALERDKNLDSYGFVDGWCRGYRLTVIFRIPELGTVYQQQYRLIRDLEQGLLHYHKERTDVWYVDYDDLSESIYMSDGSEDNLMLIDY